MDRIFLEATARALHKSLAPSLSYLFESLCKNCYGCQIDHPSQRDHDCLEYSTKRTCAIMEPVQVVDEKVSKADLCWNISEILAEQERNQNVVTCVKVSEAIRFLFA